MNPIRRKSRKMSRVIVWMFGTALTLFSTNPIFAQQTAARPDRGIMPGASYSVSDIENISLTSGNVNMSIPLASLPPIAGGKLKFTLSAVYNSKLWNVTRTENQLGTFNNCATWVVDNQQLSERGGWQITGGYSIQIREGVEDFNYAVPELPPGSCEADPYENNALHGNWYRIVLFTPDGAEHELRPVDNSNTYQGSRGYLYGYYRDTFNTLNTPMRYYTYDGTFISAVINPSGYSNYFTLTLNDGTKVVQGYDGVQRITDTNGNSIKMFGDTNGVSHFQDEQTGREIKYSYDPDGNNGLGQGEVEYQTVGGSWQTVTINFGATGVKGKLYKINSYDIEGGELGNGAPCSYYNVIGNDQYPVTVPVIREIIYPATEPSTAPPKFTFAYNSDSTTANVSDTVQWWCGATPQTYTRTVSNGMGELSQVTTPPGATVDYTYSQDGTHNFYPLEGNNDIARNIITEKEVTHDGGSETWTYQIYQDFVCGGTVIGPDGSQTIESCYPKDPAYGTPYATGEFSGLALTSIRSGKERIDRHWTSLVFNGGYTHATGGLSLGNFNPVVDAEYLSLLDGSGNRIKISAKTFQYDYNGNVVETKEYDWFDPGSVTFDGNGVPTGVPAGATLLRTTTNSYYNGAGTSSSSNVYSKRSLSNNTPLILNAVQQSTSGPAIAQFSYDGNSYGVAPTAGNLTSKRVWFDLESRWITTSNTYGLYGNLATSTDARGKVTTFGYLNPALGLPTSVAVDPQNGTGVQTTTTAFDYSTGLVTSTTDPNNKVTTIDYTNQRLNSVDPFGRPGVIIGPDLGSGVNHRTRTLYWDDSRMVQTLADLNSEGDGLLKIEVLSDELGRTIESRQYETTSAFIAVRRTYDIPSRLSKTSNPFRAGETVVWTTTVTDLLGRVTSVTTPDNAVVTTAYNANFTTVTDQAGKQRRSMVDGVGRLIRIDEPDANGNLGATTSPTQPTSYDYDVFGNLRHVYQGTETRTFTYDSLSRLRTALNPESGPISYQYDDNGNLLVKTDARFEPSDPNRKVSTHFSYDALNRVTRKWYNGSSSVSATAHNSPPLPTAVAATDEVKYFYDSQNIPGAPSFDRGFAVGRLVATTYGGANSGDYFGFDALGRAKLKIQQTGGINYQTSAIYNLAGAITTMTYPSVRTITNTFDNAGRLSTFAGNLGDGTTRTYANEFQYTAWNGLQQEKFETQTPIYHKQRFNSRGQLWDIRASTVPFATDPANGDRGAIVNYYSNTFTQGGSGADNNGNLLRQESYIPGSSFFQDNFTYDALNRLTSIAEKLNGTGTDSYKQVYIYDRWGNRTIDQVNTTSNVPKPNFGVNTSNNRLTAPAGYTMSYDTAGNLTNDTFTGQGTRTYDAENRMISAVTATTPATYAYDGDGRRIKRSVNGTETWQVYGFGGELLAEYPANGTPTNPQKEYGYRNGELLVTTETSSGGGGSSAQPVTWTNAVGVSVSGNNLTKTAAEGWGNAGASSTQSIASGDGYVETTISETNKYRMIGLSNGDSSQTYGDIDFAFYPAIGAALYIYEGGTLRGTFGTYATGDVLRVAVEGGVVKYRKNGTLVYTSTVSPTYPLLVDTSFHSNGATLNNVVISGAAGGGSSTQNASWTNSVGVAVNGNNLTKTAAEGWGNAGAASTQTIASGDGYVEFTASETNTYRMIGLSNGNSHQNYDDIDFAIYPIVGGGLQVYEGGVLRGNVGSYSTGDTLKVAVEGGVVKYRKNGTLLYTSTISPTYPLLVDTSLYSNGATLNNVVINGGGGGSSTQNASWTNSVGVAANSNNLTKTAAEGWGNAGASSTQSIASGDGYVETTISETNKYRMIGLSNGDSHQNYTDIDFAFYPAIGASLQVYEGGVSKGTFGTYATGDVLRVAIEGGVVKYRKNGTLLYTSTVTATYPLLVDTSLYSNGATLNNVVISGAAGGGGGSSTQIRWLVTDHLGTPRMIFDQTGSLANVSRHDYLPFGEELYAGTGGRTAGMGYGVTDNVRQKFTQKERDTETGLDYFLARYYSSQQGRFSSTDPLLSSASIYDPQTWNRYSYALNNPTRYVDPLGLYEWDASLGGPATDEELGKSSKGREIVKRRNEFRHALRQAAVAMMKGKLSAKQRNEINRSLSAYGGEGQANGVVVANGKTKNGDAAETSSGNDDGYTVDPTTGTVTPSVRVTFNKDKAIDPEGAAHEGSHAADRIDHVKGLTSVMGLTDWIALPSNRTEYDTEVRAYQVSAAVAQGRRLPSYNADGYEYWNSGWKAADREAKVSKGINRLLEKKYKVTSASPGPRQFELKQ